MRKARPPDDPDSSHAAYQLALRWLTARELSEGQVRARLAERGFSERAVRPAIERLVGDRSLDDRRTAAAVARTEAHVRRHGPRRVFAKLISLQIDRDLAGEVVRELFGEDDESSLVASTLARRLRGDFTRLGDPRERRKVLGYLVRQGFSVGAATAAIRDARR